MICSFFLSYGLNKTVFIADSPQLRKDSVGYIASLVQNAVSSTNTQESPQKTIEGGVVQQVSRGVYAGEREDSGVRVYQIDEIQWKEYSYTTAEGRTVSIRVPEGDVPPPGVHTQVNLEND